jgi:hypothetical protein
MCNLNKLIEMHPDFEENELSKARLELNIA